MCVCVCERERESVCVCVYPCIHPSRSRSTGRDKEYRPHPSSMGRILCNKSKSICKSLTPQAPRPRSRFLSVLREMGAAGGCHSPLS